MRVVAVNKNTYTLQNLVNLKTRDVHVTQLKPFHYDQTETDPEEIARKEAQEFLMDNILQHRGVLKRSTLEYNDSYNSWQSWAEVRDNSKLNRYLYDNKLRTHLTKEQRREIENPVQPD